MKCIACLSGIKTCSHAIPLHIRLKSPVVRYINNLALTVKMQHSVELKDPLWTKHIIYPDPSQTIHNLREQDLIIEMFY